MGDLNEVIQSMQRPEAYPHAVSLPVEVVQTQMSVVFLTGEYAYKLKKPVNFGYLDYSTLELRHTLCLREIDLNKRLCPDYYIAVVPINDSSGKIAVAGPGTTVEYAVKMRQLPRDRMMDALLPAGGVTPEMVREVALKLADFHSMAETGPYINSFGELRSVMVNTEENFSQTEEYIGRSITREQFSRIKNYSNSFLRSHGELLHQRIERGRIRDCHGDLHAAHVCFTKDGICIYDCIEFNDRFRYADVASEVAFLAMDLDRHGRKDLSRDFVAVYVEASRDDTLHVVLPFYKCYRAYVRGKVESFKVGDAYLSADNKEQALKNAKRYFDLAFAYASKPPTLIIMAGLAGTGKTTVAQSLAQALGAIVVSSDVVRKKLAGIPPVEHRYEGFQRGIYTPEFTRNTYDALFGEARATLEHGESAILDASFQKAADRKRARDLAVALSARFLAIECVLPESEAKRRLDRRLDQVSASDGRWEIYQKQKTTFESISELPDSEHFIVDTSHNWNDALARIVEKTDQ